jgi:hypothetical protein
MAPQPIGFVDDDLKLHQCSFLGLPVLGTIAQLSTIIHHTVIIAIGNNLIRQKIYRQLQMQGEKFINIHHPSSFSHHWWKRRNREWLGD